MEFPIELGRETAEQMEKSRFDCSNRVAQ